MKPECGKCSLTYSLTDHSFERNGFRVHLDRMVRGGTEPKRQILLVHGLTYSSHEFDINYKDYSLVRFLARNGYAVWRIDITGYGQSERISDGFLPNSDYAAEDINAAVREIVRISGTEKIDVLGWSWGTVTSGRFAARYPEHLNRLVLYAPVIMGHAKRDVTEPFHHNDWVHAAGDFQLDENGGYDYDIVEPVIVEMFCSSCWHYDGDFSPNGGRRDIMNGFEPPSPGRHFSFTATGTLLWIMTGSKPQWTCCRKAPKQKRYPEPPMQCSTKSPTTAGSRTPSWPTLIKSEYRYMTWHREVMQWISISFCSTALNHWTFSVRSRSSALFLTLNCIMSPWTEAS